MENKLTLIRELFGEEREKMCRVGLYRCECGNEKKIEIRNVEIGKEKTCGCWRATSGNKKHNLSKTTEYITWVGAKQRCFNVANKVYPRYGGRGITMCQNWVDSFDNFIRDMGKKPSEDHSLDRIDNSKGYSKDNCRWANKKEQSRNRRGLSILNAYGTEMCLSEWSEIMEINHSNTKGRRQRGWSKYDAIFRKTKPQKKLLKLMDILFFPDKQL